MVLASLVPQAELSPEMEDPLGMETVREPMSGTAQQENFSKVKPGQP